jgi:hypothetical protein
MRMAYLTMSAGLCAIASCAWGGVSFYAKGGAEKTISPPPSAVERTNKSDRMVRAFNIRGAVMPALSVEIVDSPDAAVTVRDHDGSILYRVSPTERITVVAKRAVQKPVVAPERVSAPLQQQGQGQPGQGQQGKTTTFICGLHYDGVTAPFVLDGPMDGPHFLAC